MCAVQTKVQEMQKQMAAVSLDKQDLQQAAQLQQQLQRALQEQQHMAARLQQDWQQHEAKLSARYIATDSLYFAAGKVQLSIV